MVVDMKNCLTPSLFDNIEKSRQKIACVAPAYRSRNSALHDKCLIAN